MQVVISTQVVVSRSGVLASGFKSVEQSTGPTRLMCSQQAGVNGMYTSDPVAPEDLTLPPDLKSLVTHKICNKSTTFFYINCVFDT